MTAAIAEKLGAKLISHGESASREVHLTKPTNAPPTGAKTISAVTRAIIPAAGLGTRLLSVTKEQPKEMLAVFAKAGNDELSLKPVVQLIFEQLFESGIREFFFVVGRGKRALEDHFTPDKNFLKLLEKRKRREKVRDLRKFYSMVSRSSVFWVNQAEPKGFGHAVLSYKPVFEGEPVFVHAGDNCVISPDNGHIRRLVDEQRRSDADATLLLREVKDPRRYGVAEVVREGGETRVTRVVEKPDRPASKLALLPAYVFKPVIFDALKGIKAGKGGEIQLTDGIQLLIERGLKVNAVQLKRNELWLDVGTPETYWEALRMSYEKFSGR